MEKCTKENLEMSATTIRGLIGYHKRMTMNECAVCEECDTHKAIGGCPKRAFEEERYRRYKKICYRNLVIKSLLTFLLGILFAGFLRFFVG